MSATKPAAELKLLTEAVQALNSALAGLSPKESADERSLALYNLILAHRNLWKTSVDWDATDHVERALAHGQEAWRLMDGLEVPAEQRDVIAQTLLELVLANGEGSLDDPRARQIVIAIVGRILKGKDASRMSHDQRDALAGLLADARRRETPTRRSKG